MTWVKICGMTNLEDALVAVEAGADAVGFVFYEKSPRCVTVETAREICGKLPGSVEKVGVFVNASPERVFEVTKDAGLTAAQLHGDEYKNPECFSAAGKLLFCFPMGEILHEMTEPIGGFVIPKLPKSASVLLDSGTQELRGGTGRAFGWAEARWLVVSLQRLHSVVIAGGLTASNVEHAIGFLRPWGVDVASGVEASPGKKDPEKVRAFVKVVRDFDRKAG
jgi:phosphoribosylanthranilate isomerase